jgi:hypothetical protein
MELTMHLQVFNQMEEEKACERKAYSLSKLSMMMKTLMKKLAISKNH